MITYRDKAPASIDLEKVLALRGDKVGLQSLVDTAVKIYLVTCSKATVY